MFCDRLRETRKKRGLLSREVADAIGVGRSSYCQYEVGRREPDISIIKKIACFLGVTCDYLIGLTDNPQEVYNSSTDEGHILYDKLDTEDKAEIRGEMKQMLKDDKYTDSEREPEGKQNV